MSSAVHSLGEGSLPSHTYRFVRGLVRIGLRLCFRKLRLLGAEALPDADACILVVRRSANLFDALILVGALQRQVCCFVPRRVCEGLVPKLLASSLGMIGSEAESHDNRATIGAGCERLSRGNVVAVFMEPQTTEAGKPCALPLAAATMALEAASRWSGQRGPAIFPVHMFVPAPRFGSREAVVYLDVPSYPEDDQAPGSISFSNRAQALATGLEKRLRENVFRFRREQTRQFFSDVGEVLRDELEDEWAQRPNWKQKIEGFELSRFVVEWAEQLNDSQPELLIALRESLDACREARRRCSLERLKAEGAGANSAWRRGWRRLGSLRVPAQAAKARRMRKEFIEELNRGIDACAQARPGRASDQASGGAGILRNSDV